jgi:PAS domain S-box-containing protein
VVGRHIGLLIPLDRPEELSDLLAHVRAGTAIRNFRTQRLRKNKTPVEVSITVSPVVTTDGSILGGSVIAHDLTLHNQQIADLREAHRRADEATSTLETLQEAAPVGFGLVDLEFRLTHLNQHLASFSGAKVVELLGRTIVDVVPDIWLQVERILRTVITTGKAVRNVEVSGEVDIDHGRRHHWLASYYPVELDAEIIGVGSSWSTSPSGVKPKSSVRSP